MPDPQTDPNAAPVEAPAAAGAPPAGTPAPVAAAPAPDIAKLIADAVAPLHAEISAMRQGAPAVPAAPAAPTADPLDTEIQLRMDQLAAIRRGELDAQYEPEVQRRLVDAQTRKTGREIVERESARTNFVSSYNSNLARAFEEFPELKDSNSELYKETVRILGEEGQEKQIRDALAARGAAAEKIDFSRFDARLNLRAAREAFAIVSRRQARGPVSQNPNSAPNPARAGLEPGRGSAPVSEGELDKLEREATESGDPNAWTRLLIARDRAARARQTA